VSLDFALNAPPGTFLVERFTKMEMLNIECSSRMNSRPESTLAEIASYSHPTFRNLLIEGHIRVDSSRILDFPSMLVEKTPDSGLGAR